MQHFRKTAHLSTKWGENEKREEEGQHYSYSGKLLTGLEVQMSPCKALPLPRTSSHPPRARSRLRRWTPSGNESGAVCRSRWAAPRSALETQAEEKASLQEWEPLSPTSSNFTPDCGLWTVPYGFSKAVSDGFQFLSSATETLVCPGYDFPNRIYV